MRLVVGVCQGGRARVGPDIHTAVERRVVECTDSCGVAKCPRWGFGRPCTRQTWTIELTTKKLRCPWDQPVLL